MSAFAHRVISLPAQHCVAFRPKRTLSRKLHYFDSLMFDSLMLIELVSWEFPKLGGFTMCSRIPNRRARALKV